VQPLDWSLADAVVNGGRLYLQGATLGVGASYLAIDYARAFNQESRRKGLPQRLLYARFAHGTKTIAHVMDTLGAQLKAPLTNAEIRFRSSHQWALRVLGGAALQRAVGIILDHVYLLPANVRAALATLFFLTDPNYSVDVDAEPDASACRRVGIILVDHTLPETLFRTVPEVLLQLQGHHVVLQPYTTVEQVAEAVRQAGIGLSDLSLKNANDREIATTVLRESDGLPAHMGPLFELIDLVAYASKVRRPTPEIVAAALPFHRKMVVMLGRRANVPGGRQYTLRAIGSNASPKPNSRGAGGEDSAGPRRRAVAAETGRRSRPESALKLKRAAREIAKHEGRAMRRKGHANLDWGDQ
jgi:hypothetical protein